MIEPLTEDQLDALYFQERQSGMATARRMRRDHRWLAKAARTLQHMPLNAPIQRLAGIGDEANRRIEMANRAAAAEDYQGRVPTTIKRGFRGATEQLPCMVASAVTTGPYGAIANAAVGEGDRAITSGRDAGLEGKELATYVDSKATIEALPAIVMQRMGLGGLEKALGGQGDQVFATSFKEAMKSLGKPTLQELPEELVTEIGHSLADRMSGINPDALKPGQFQQMLLDRDTQKAVRERWCGPQQC